MARLRGFAWASRAWAVCPAPAHCRLQPRWSIALALVPSLLLPGQLGCRDEAATPAAGGASPATAEESSMKDEALRQAREAVARSLNPKGLPPYSGPVGGVKGSVHVTGDPPPLVPDMIAKLPAEGCPRAHELERKVYREGGDRTLADVLITVTEYDGFVQPKDEAIRVEIKGCAFDARVLAMTFGQRFDVFNLDNASYMPRLVGTPSYALRVAMPGGSPVPIFAPRAGPYLLADQTREYMRADVYVLNYPTFDVTGLDGRFEIDGVPVGDVNVTAFVPAFGKILNRRVKLRPGVLEDVSFEFSFSESEYRARSSETRSAAPDVVTRDETPAPSKELEKQ